jgi:branched-chain amino acid transport system substrate-binding protein
MGTRWARGSICVALGLLAVLALVALSGCGGGGSSSSSSSSSTPEETTTAANPETEESTGEGEESTAFDQSDVEWGEKYAGYKASKVDPKLKPVTIGFTNLQGGQQSFPEITESVEEAVKFVNEELGGIEGHELKLVTCFVQTEEDGQKCGVQFVNDPEVDLVMGGLLVLGGESLYSTIRHKLVAFTSSPGSLADVTSPGVYFLGSGFGLLTAESYFVAERLKAKSVAILYQENPAGKAAFAAAAEVFEKGGEVEVKAVPVSNTATAPEVTAAVQASGATNAGAIMPLVTEEQCESLYDALKQLAVETPVVAAYSCGNYPLAEHVNPDHPELPDGWYWSNFGYSQWVEGTRFATYKKIMAPTGTKNTYTYFGVPAVANVMGIVRAVSETGVENITTANLEKTMESFTGPVPLMASPVKCGFSTTFVSQCSDTAGISGWSEGKMHDEALVNVETGKITAPEPEE